MIIMVMIIIKSQNITRLAKNNMKDVEIHTRERKKNCHTQASTIQSLGLVLHFTSKPTLLASPFSFTMPTIFTNVSLPLLPTYHPPYPLFLASSLLLNLSYPQVQQIYLFYLLTLNHALKYILSPPHFSLPILISSNIPSPSPHTIYLSLILPNPRLSPCSFSLFLPTLILLPLSPSPQNPFTFPSPYSPYRR